MYFNQNLFEIESYSNELGLPWDSSAPMISSTEITEPQIL